MLRGINRQEIFLDDEDCVKYLQCVRETKEISNFVLYAYCLMGNHIHLLLKEGGEPADQIFKRIGARYVYWYNWKYERSGHLFQDRYKSEPIDDEAYFLAALRYIYQNPVKAGLCKTPGEYPWSSYPGSGKNNRLADQEQVFKMIPEEQFGEFMEKPAEGAFIDIAAEKRITDRKAIELIKEICENRSISGMQVLQPDKQAAFIEKLYDNGCSIRQMARLTGITKARIERMLK
jgi:Transposase and inactivated derivatives